MGLPSSYVVYFLSVLLPLGGKVGKRENDDDDVDGGVIGRRLRYRLAAVATDRYVALDVVRVC